MKKQNKKIRPYKTLYDLFQERKKGKACSLSLQKRRYKSNECYYCGTILNKKNKTRDHIPSQCLFVGFAEKYKQNRITVPCCKECNFKLSQYENEFRNFIGITNSKNKKAKLITQKSVKELFMINNFSRLHFSDKGQVYGVDFECNSIEITHIKNFKGVFYRLYGYRLPDNFQTNIVSSNIPLPFNINDYLECQKWFYSGSDKIFKFKIAILNRKMKVVSSINRASFIFCKLIYHQSHIIYIIAKRLWEKE